MSSENIEKWRNELEIIQRQANILEPSKEIMVNWKESVDDYVFSFLENLNDEKSYTFKNNKKFLNIEFSEDPKKLESLIEKFKAEFNDSGISAASGKYLGFIPGGGLYPSALADYIADITNKYSGVIYGCPAAVDIENSVIKWTCSLIGYPKTSTGNICSGASTGILYGIHVARDSFKVKSEFYSRLVIYCTSVCHGCVFKSLKVAGLGDSVIRKVPTDQDLRMLPGELNELIKVDVSNNLIPFMIFSSAGSTDVGSVDPFDEINKVADKYKCWHHIDGAYGGYFMLLNSQKEKFKGIEQADSITLDPHKSLFIPYGCGIVLYKNAKKAISAFNVEPNQENCLQDCRSEEISPANVSLELTKPFRGLRIWLPLQIFGVKAFRDCLEEKLILTQYFYEKIKLIGYQVGPTPQLTVVVFRYFCSTDTDSDLFNESILEMVKTNGISFVSSTRINGAYWLRCCILSCRTHDNIELSHEWLSSILSFTLSFTLKLAINKF